MAEIAKISQMGRFPQVTRREGGMILKDDLSFHSPILCLSLIIKQNCTEQIDDHDLKERGRLAAKTQV